MLALTSATGKLGSAVISAILENNLIDPKDLVICSSSPATHPHLTHLLTTHPTLTLRHADFTTPSTLAPAFTSCTSLFLVSTPAIHLDYNNAPPGQGREAHHIPAIDAALAAGVRHIYYTSLAFGNPSKAGVMRAHIRTEAYLRELEAKGKCKVTVIREGLYNESWPLYFGYYYGLKEEKRKEVLVAGDGRVCWTSIPDLGFATARILAADSEEWAGKMVYLSQRRGVTLGEIAGVVSKAKGEEVRLKVVDRKAYEDFYVGEMGMERAAVEWWSSTYEALEEGECEIDDGTLEGLLAEVGRKPKQIEETIEEMMK
ncbi:nucleoside-diphosphate-sugar epimerase [Pyrenophora teres f. maculata]|nr:nucleoside-diphosphate-sugar epimerase [Pyrenophora teres f. maculata]